MGTYKQPCVHCGNWLDTAEEMCPHCGSATPFGFTCPTCLHAINPSDALCPGCGRPLYVPCPYCGQPTFVQEVCQHCGGMLMVRCDNTRCNAVQFFQNTKCTACGAKLKGKLPTK